MNIRRLRVGSVVAGAVALVAAGYGFGSNHAHADAPAQPTAAVSSDAPARSGLPDFSSIVSRYGPAVVNVRVAGTMMTDAGARGPNNDPRDPFSDFFRQFQHQMPQERVPMHGIGSGFIISPDGYILTNAHVVKDADQVTVKLTDRREFKAKVVGVDKATDVAVIKIDARDLPTVKLGDASKERVGEWVVAIGAPFGFENTATAGIVSATGRSLPNEGYVRFLQTDVPVNPGNSGGPLFNLNGEVIGINSQIYSGTGGYQGISFAIPINLAMQVETQLVKHGKVERGQLGIQVQSVDESLAQAFGLKHAGGALISSVLPDSPGARGGLRSGDVILSFNGQTIEDSADLPPLVAGLAPGSKADLGVWRDHENHNVTVQVGEAAGEQTASVDSGDTGKPRLGLAVRPLTPEERSEAKVSNGLMVENVTGPAAKAGIQPGDIVLAVNNQPVSSVSDVRKLIAGDAKSVALLVEHEGAKIFVPVDLG
jgi:serine protease Do